MKRGDIYWAELAPRSGAEQSGRRPVIVISHDGFNRTPNWRSVIVVPMTTSPAQARRGPTAIQIPALSSGLGRAGIAICHQVTTLDREKLTRRIGELPLDLLHAVENGIKAALDLD